MEEDFAELDREYPYQIKFHDKEGSIQFKPSVCMYYMDHICPILICFYLKENRS